MNLDITFCSKTNCKNEECKRNQYNINAIMKDLRFICMANFEDCEFWEVEDE